MNVALIQPAANNNRQRPATVLESAWHKLAQVALGIIPARVAGQADHIDAARFVDDIDLFEREVKRMLNAFREHASDHFGSVDLDYFQQAEDLMSDGFSQLRGEMARVEKDMRSDNGQFGVGA